MKHLLIIIMLSFMVFGTHAQTIDYTYDAAGNMIQRTVIILSPMMADTSDNDHSHPSPGKKQRAQIAETTIQETTHTNEPVTSRTGCHSFTLYPNLTHALVQAGTRQQRIHTE